MAEMKFTVKDSVFTYLFKHPKYALQLYQTLHPEDSEATEGDCKVITLENVIVNGMYNDLGIYVRDKLIILVEAQSSFNPNIALRIFLYLAMTYKDFIDERGMDLYGRKALRIPRPELYMIYSGEKKDVPDIVKLSDLFEGAGVDADVEVKVQILRSDQTRSIVDQYIRFCQITDAQRVLYGYTEKAVRETIRVCLEEGVLAPFLMQRKKEVNDIMTTLFSQERIMEMHDAALIEESRQEGLKKGIKKGIKEGVKKGMYALIASLRELSVPDTKIAEMLEKQFQLSQSETYAVLEEYDNSK